MQKYFNQLCRVWTSPGNRGRRATAVLRAARWFVHTRLTDNPIDIQIFSTTAIRCHTNGFVSRSVMLFGEWYAYDALKFVDSFLRPGDSFLDIGANIGLFSLLASEKLTPRSLFCVEPGQLQRLRLQENFEMNGRLGVNVFPFAVGDQTAKCRFTKGDAISHIVQSSTGDAGAETESVEMRMLDDFLPHQPFALTKLDVEGYELSALRGAKTLMEEGCLPIILFEINGSSERYGVKAEELRRYLVERGYRLGLYNHDTAVIATTPPFDGDVLAFNEVGLSMVADRMPGVSIR